MFHGGQVSILTHCFAPMRNVSRVPVQERHGQDEVDGDASISSQVQISIDQKKKKEDTQTGWNGSSEGGNTHMALYAKLRKRSAFTNRWRDWKYGSWDATRSISSATARWWSSLRDGMSFMASAISSRKRTDRGSGTYAAVSVRSSFRYLFVLPHLLLRNFKPPPPYGVNRHAMESQELGGIR